MIVNCKEIAKKEKHRLKDIVCQMKIKPYLCVIQVGNNPASNAYIKGKKNDCEEIGINFKLKKFPEQTSKEDIIQYINNTKDYFTHMMVQLPIPFSDSDTLEIINSIPPEKDVDGLTENSKYIPCTPLGVMKIFDEINYDLTGKDVMIINRSELVGRPLVNLLLDKNATVTICHSKTENLIQKIQNVDIIITAVGKKDFINPYMVKSGQVIIDVGITRDEQTNKICGDCSKRLYDENNSVIITTVPNGVGLMTRWGLLNSIVTSCE